MKCPRCQQTLKEDALFCDRCGLAVSSSHDGASDEPLGEASDPTSPTSDPFIGYELGGKYEILSRLAKEDATSFVYRARRKLIGDEVAVKIILGCDFSDAATTESFRREVGSAAIIQHPNVVKVFDYGEAKLQVTFAYVVMEMLEGENLREHLRRKGRIPSARAFQIIFEACAGVGAAHRRNVYHGALRPESIFILPAREGRDEVNVKVLDFGATKLHARSGAKSFSPGDPAKEAFYLSPEQIRGEPSDARTDVYSLGAILYEMLAGSPPFAASNAAGVCAKHLDEQPPLMPSGAGVSPSIDSVIKRALSKDPNARQADAVELARELQLKTTSLQTPFHEATLKSLSGLEETVVPSPRELEATRLEEPFIREAAQSSLLPHERQFAENQTQTAPMPYEGPRRTSGGLIAGLLIGGILFGAIVTIMSLYLADMLKWNDNERASYTAQPTPVSTTTPTPTPTPRPTPFTNTLNNANAITTMAGSRQALPYPSEIYVSLPQGAITKATVTLNRLSHSWPGDLQILLVSPTGHRAVLMSSVGGNRSIPSDSPVTLTFNDSAPTVLTGSSAVASGTYKPSRNGVGDFGSAAPPPPYANSLSIFNGTNPNGAWRLFVTDVADTFTGTIAGGWSLNLTIDPSQNPSSASPPQIVPPLQTGGGTSANRAP